MCLAAKARVALVATVLAGCTSLAAPTATRNPTPTSLPTALPTPTPGLVLRDGLDAPETSQLHGGATTSGTFAFVNKRYAISVAKPNALVWSAVGGVYGDVSVDVDLTFGERVGATNAGVLFRMRDERNFYLFSISGDGYYALDARENGTWRSLIEWTRWPTIDTRGGTNLLGLVVRADHISIFLNGELLGETVDGTFHEGSVALAVNTYETTGVTVYFDNLAVTPAEHKP